MYTVNNGQKSRVELITDKETGGIYRHYIDEGRITSILLRNSPNGVDYAETDEAHQHDYTRKMSREEAEALMDSLKVDAELRALILKDIE